MRKDDGRWTYDVKRSRHPGFAIGGAIGVAIAGILLAFAVTAAIAIGVQIFGGSIPPGPRFGLVFLGGAIGLAGAGIAYLRIRGFSLFEYVGVDRPSLRDLGWTVGGYMVAIGLVFTAGMVLTVLEMQPDTANRAAMAGLENPSILLWLVPLSFLVIAPAEELLFRGVVQGRLREAFRPIIAIPATAAIFAAIHYFSLTGGSGARFTAISILFFPSLVFGLAYERTRNLLVPIFIHGSYNATLALLFYVSLTFVEGPTVPA